MKEEGYVYFYLYAVVVLFLLLTWGVLLAKQGWYNLTLVFLRGKVLA